MPSKNRKNPYFMPTLAIIFSSLLLTSCSTGKDSPTSQIKQVTDGVEKDSGSVAIRGLLLVSQPDGSAVLVGTIVNSAADADSIVSIAVGGVAAPITGAPLPLAQNAPVIFGGDSANASSIIGGVFFNLCAKALDVNIQRLGITEVIAAPDAVDELGASKHAT